jgi:hypothetical protein
MRRLRAGLVTPPPGGLGTRSGGTRTPPRGARWTGTGANASSPETRTREPKVAAVERREARLRRHGGDAPRQACRAASPAAQGTCAKPPRFSALRSLKGARKGRRPTRGRSNNTGAHARPFGIRAMALGLSRRSAAKAGCLTFKSKNRGGRTNSFNAASAFARQRCACRCARSSPPASPRPRASRLRPASRWSRSNRAARRR